MKLLAIFTVYLLMVLTSKAMTESESTETLTIAPSLNDQIELLLSGETALSCSNEGETCNEGSPDSCCSGCCKSGTCVSRTICDITCISTNSTLRSCNKGS